MPLNINITLESKSLYCILDTQKNTQHMCAHTQIKKVQLTSRVICKPLREIFVSSVRFYPIPSVSSYWPRPCQVAVKGAKALAPTAAASAAAASSPMSSSVVLLPRGKPRNRRETGRPLHRWPANTWILLELQVLTHHQVTVQDLQRGHVLKVLGHPCFVF